MKILHLILVFLILGFYACNSKKSTPGKQDILDSIAKVEALIISDSTASITNDMATLSINLYIKYSNLFPEDTLSASFLFKSAEIYRALNNGINANQFYKRVISEYPNYSKTPVCYFLQGFVYENINQDYVKAKEYYQMYIDKYPNGEFANDAKILIENLGKTPEEMIREFEENQKNNPQKTV